MEETKRILIVDNSVMNRAALAEGLGADGIVEAVGVDEAFGAVRNSSDAFDFVIYDRETVGESEEDLIGEVKAATSDSAVVVVALVSPDGQLAEKDVERIRADVMLKRPFDVSGLRGLIFG